MDRQMIFNAVGYLIMIIAILYSRRDRSDDKIDKIFEKMDNLVSEPLCKERRDGLKEDIKNVGDIARGKNGRS